jgi:hypothetical protein
MRHPFENMLGGEAHGRGCATAWGGGDDEIQAGGRGSRP